MNDHDHNDHHQQKQPTTARPTDDHVNTQKKLSKYLKLFYTLGVRCCTMTHRWSEDMNKHQQKEAARCAQYAAAGQRGMAARGLSALYRSAMRDTQKAAILAFSLALGVVSHDDFIV